MYLFLNKQFLIAGCLYMGSLTIGVMIGWTAPVIPKLKNPDQTPLESVISDGQAAWIVSLQYMTMAGPWVSGYLCNAIGRKPSLIIAGSTLFIGFAMLGLAKHLMVIYIGRSLTGVGVGMMFVTNLIYLGEIASTNIRGTMLTLTGFFSTVGTLLMYSVGPFVPYAVTGWLPAGIAAVYLLGIYFIVPETPLYLILAGKKEQAIANLEALGRKDDTDNVFAVASEKPISNAAQLFEIYTIKSNRKAFLLITTLNSLQQMSGVIIVLSLATSIFDQTGLTLPSHISTIIVGVTQVVAGTVAPLLVERAGRKLLMLVSTAICALSLTALGVYFYLFNTGHPAAESIQWISLLSVMLFFMGYFSGFGIIPNTFIGEMFTCNVRSLGSSATVSIGWIFGFGVAIAYGYMMPAWGPAVTFWIYAGACAFAFFFSVIFVPETKGKSLLEIQQMLS